MHIPIRVVVLLASFLATSAAVVHAQGNADGVLDGDGRVRGDVSMKAGETDRITVHLDAGASLTLQVTAGFHVAVTLTDPHGDPIDLGATGGTRVILQNHSITVAGDYQLAIASADGSQGLYTVTVKQRWAKSIAIAGSGPTTIDVDMPAGARLSGVVRGADGAPGIASVQGPTGNELLSAPITAGAKATKLPALTTSTAGTYHLAIAPNGAGAWNGTLRRALAFAPPARLDLRNGLDGVSFANDGVGQLFRTRCSGCHGWAGSYAGVRAYASRAIERIRGGVMPPGGRLPNAEIALVQAWIATGKAP